METVAAQVLAMIADAAETGREAPLQRDMAAALGTSERAINETIAALVERRAIERRADPECRSRRCYRIVATGRATARWQVAEELAPMFRRQRKTERPVLQSRACMCCSETFDSSGPGNRLCGTCRHKDGGWMPAARIAL